MALNLTDKSERRKDKDDSGDIPGEALSTEIHRELSEASQRPKEQETKVQEKPDHRELAEETHLRPPEESGRHEKVEQPAEMKRADETDTKPEQISEQKDPIIKKSPESQERESRLPEKETAPEQLARDEERQSTSKTQTEITIEQQVEQPDSKPSLGKPELQESNSKGKESASEDHTEQEKVVQEKPDHRYPNEETHQISETRQRHERDKQPSEITRTQDTYIKPEPVVTQTDPRNTRELSERSDKEGYHATRENQVDKPRDLLVEQTNHRESPQTNLVNRPSEHLEQPVLHDAMWYKKLTDTKRVQRLTIKSNGRIVFPAEYLERTVPGFRRGQESALECTSEGKTFYCKYRGADKNGPVKHMEASVPQQIGQSHERCNFVFAQLTPEVFAKHFPETRFPDAFTATETIPAYSVLQGLTVKDGKASLKIKDGDKSRTLEGLVKDFGYDEHARAAFMKIELKDEKNTITFTTIHNGIGKARIESTNETIFRENITATLNEVEAKGDRLARGVTAKFIYELEKTGNINPQTLDDVRILAKNALEYSPNALVAVLACIRRDFANLGPENALKVLHSYVDKESPLTRIYTTHIHMEKTHGQIDIPKIWREIRGIQNGETYAIMLKDQKGTSLTVIQELRPVSGGIWHIHFDKDISKTFPDRTIVDMTVRKSEMSLIIKELGKTLPQTVGGVRDIRLEGNMLHLYIWNRMFSQSYTLEMHPSEKPSYQSAKIAGACLYSKFTDYSGEEKTFRFIYKSDRLKPVFQYLDNKKFRRVADIKYYDPFKRIEMLLPKRSNQSIYIDEFMNKSVEDREVVTNYHYAKDSLEKAIIGHNSFANYITGLEEAKDIDELVKYIDKASNKWGPDLVFDDRNIIFNFGRGIIEIKSLELNTAYYDRARSMASSSIKSALKQLHKYLDGKPIKLKGLEPFLPDFGLAASQIFDMRKGNIIRTIVISIRNADGSYTERNWRVKL